MKPKRRPNLRLSIMTIAIILPASADLLFYEPFDYPDAVLNDQPAGPLGSAGVWVSRDGSSGSWWVHPEGTPTGQGDDLHPTLGSEGLNGTSGTLFGGFWAVSLAVSWFEGFRGRI